MAKVKRMIVSTYQAASGAGAAAMEELKDQTRDVLDGKPAQPKIFPTQVRQLQRGQHTVPSLTSSPGCVPVETSSAQIGEGRRQALGLPQCPHLVQLQHVRRCSSA
jgi:hypothetical protein